LAGGLRCGVLAAATLRADQYDRLPERALEILDVTRIDFGEVLVEVAGLWIEVGPRPFLTVLISSASYARDSLTPRRR
jgi:hypothetical protein